ncbi:MAG: morphogenetic protein, partial [Plesiomonas sp.]
EGVAEINGQFSNQEMFDMAARLHLNIIEDARVQYALLWESIYGAGSWDKNPWVWVIEFKKAEGL